MANHPSNPQYIRITMGTNTPEVRLFASGIANMFINNLADVVLTDTSSGDILILTSNGAWVNQNLWRIIENRMSSSGYVTSNEFLLHTSNYNNPHQVSLEQARQIGNVLAGAIDMGSYQINNLAEPTTNGDAATKAYADAVGLYQSGVVGISENTITTIDIFPKSRGSGAVWHYTLENPTSNSMRTGTVNSCWLTNTNAVEYTEISTNTIGVSSEGIHFSTDINSGNVRLLVTVDNGYGNNWSAKIRRILMP